MIEASRIREHMEVVGCDGKHVGRVDRVLGQEIKLMRALGIGAYHALPLSFVETVEKDKVCLSITEDEAKDRWREVH
jgi:hypothetical protein